MLNELCLLRQEIKKNNPLIHCLTNHISINDCANTVLAVGGQPIMAEHPAEVADITANAGALAINLGNINDSRMQAMLIAGVQAKRLGIPCILDLVGIGCSRLRLDFARKFLAECIPEVIKGNVSELKALLLEEQTRGVDVSPWDRNLNDLELETLAKELAKKYNSSCLLTGPKDLVVSTEKTFLITNGHPWLAKITGTGCVLNVLAATFLSSKKPELSLLLASLLLSVAGELAAEKAQGPGSFRVRLFDYLYNISDEELSKKARIEQKI